MGGERLEVAGGRGSGLAQAGDAEGLGGGGQGRTCWDMRGWGFIFSFPLERYLNRPVRICLRINKCTHEYEGEKIKCE